MRPMYLFMVLGASIGIGLVVGRGVGQTIAKRWLIGAGVALAAAAAGLGIVYLATQ